MTDHSDEEYTEIATGNGRVIHRHSGKLAGADLRGLWLSGANLEGQSLVGTNLAGVNLTDSNTRYALFQGAEYDSSTRFPKGFYPDKRGMIFRERLEGMKLKP